MGTPFKLLNADSGKDLTFSGLNISKQFCPHCRAKGLSAVTTSHPQSSNRQRWFVKDLVDVPVECPVDGGAVGEKLVKRWQLYTRDIRPNDFVVWKARQEYPNSPLQLVHPCESHGELMVGKVLQSVPDAAILTVSRFYLHQGKYKTVRVYEAPLDPEYHTLPVSLVHGPLTSKPELSVATEVGSGMRFNPNVTRERVKVYIEFTQEYQELSSHHH